MDCSGVAIVSKRKRSVSQRALDDARRDLRAIGTDDEPRAWAQGFVVTPDEYRALILSAPTRDPYQSLAAAIRAGMIDYPRDIQTLQGYVAGYHAAMLSTPHLDHEGARIEAIGRICVEWEATCAALLLDGLPDADERLARLDRPEIAGAATDEFLDEVAGSDRATDSPSVARLRAVFEAAIGRDIEAGTAALAAIEQDHGQDVIEVFTGAYFESTRGYRRALLTLPAVANWLRTVAGHSATHGTSLVERDGGQEREAVEAVPDNWQDHDPAEQVQTRATVNAILREFLPSLPPAMRRDFEAVKLRDERAADLARRTDRSKAAVSQSLKEADQRLRKFLDDRG